MRKIRKLFDSRLFWMIISFLVSLSIWIYVVSVETVESTKTFRNVPVELVGEDTLLNMRELVITDLDTPTVTLEISGPRRIVNALEATDLIAQVDVSKLSQTAYTSLNYTIIYPSGVDRRSLQVINRSRDSVSFMVSKLTSKSVPVQGGFEGKTDSGFIQETPIFEPSTITVSGPEVYLRNVHHAYVTFGKDQTLDSTYSVEVGYTLMDSNDEPCSMENITAAPDIIRATLPVLAVKEVPLSVSVQEGAGATSENTRISIEPKVLKLAGDASVLAEINQIQLDTIDLTSFGTKFTSTYSIPVPNGIRNLSGASEATVTIEVLGVETKLFDIEEFTWIGLDEDVEVIVESEQLPVLLRGPHNLLARVTPYTIHAEADLTDLMQGLGSHMVTVTVTVPSIPGVGAIQEDGQPDYTVAIRLARRSEEAQP